MAFLSIALGDFQEKKEMLTLYPQECKKLKCTVSTTKQRVPRALPIRTPLHPYNNKDHDPNFTEDASQFHRGCIGAPKLRYLIQGHGPSCITE